MIAIAPRRLRHRSGLEQIRLLEDVWREERPAGAFARVVWSVGMMLRAARASCGAWIDEARLVSRRRQGRGGRLANWSGRLRVDVRVAVRTLRRAPWYSTAVLAVLAAGIALTTVVFAVVDGVLFKPLPFARADELFLIRGDVRATPRAQPPPAVWREIDAWTEAVPELAVTVVSNGTSGEPSADRRSYVTAEIDERFFDVIGIKPLVGGFSPDDFDAPFGGSEAPAAVWWPIIVSYELWQVVLGADPNVIGRTIPLNRRQGTEHSYRIAGILPPGFVFPIDTGGAQPNALMPIFRVRRVQSDRAYQLIARVPHGSDQVGVRERLLGAMGRLAANAPPLDPHHPQQSRVQQTTFDTISLVPVVDHLRYRSGGAFALVLGGAVLLLVLCCVNVAALAVTRGVDRQRDVVIRRALGASRWQITRGLLIEALVLAATATAIALFIAPILFRVTLELLPLSLPLLKPPVIDARALVAAGLLGLITSLLITIWPALAAARMAIAPSAPGISAGSINRRARFTVIAVQMAIGFVLLTAGGLTMASLANAWSRDPGYRRDRMILVEGFLREQRARADDVRQLEAAALRLGAVPGIDRVAVSTIQTLFARRMATRGVTSRQVSANFFDVMGLRLIEGRWPIGGEWSTGSRLAIVSRTAARELWPDRSAVGRPWQAPGEKAGTPTRTVIAVVADARFGALDEQPLADVYLPGAIEPGRTGVFYHLRTTGDAGPLVEPVVAAAKAAGLTVSQATTHQQALFASIKDRALPAWLFGSLGLVGLIIVSAGVFGLLAMSIAQRAREIGVRVALGASPPKLVAWLVREHMTAVWAGLFAGAVISLWSVQGISAQLYGVRPYDATVWATVAATMGAVALVSTLVPSRRAARVDPMKSLRAE